MTTTRSYHQAADNFDAAEWRSDDIARMGALRCALGQRLANWRESPEWKPVAAFRALREALDVRRIMTIWC